MAKLSPSRLQATLNSLATANTRAYVARAKISEHCMEVYGVDPSDIDNDAFIDCNDGGNGAASAMSVEDFDRSMRECMEREGIPMPGEEG